MHILPSRPTPTNEVLTYWVGPNGEYMLAPDNRITDPSKVGKKGWHSFEAKTAKEKEAVAAKMAEQLWDKKKNMEVQKFMREAEARNMMRNSAKIRQAKSPSRLDFELNQRILDKIEADEDKFYRLLAEEFDPTKRTSGLEMEYKEAAVGFWARGDKAQGLNNG